MLSWQYNPKVTPSHLKRLQSSATLLSDPYILHLGLCECLFRHVTYRTALFELINILYSNSLFPCQSVCQFIYILAESNMHLYFTSV
jgi:hypothetical protein